MGEEQDKGFEVIDKRGAAKEPDPDAVQVEQQAAEKEKEAGGTAETGEQPPRQPIDVYSMLRLFISMLAENAWVWMGLRLDPVTGKQQKDLVQARMAIDTLVFLADKLALQSDERERREVRAIISDLQLNFVQQSAKGD